MTDPEEEQHRRRRRRRRSRRRSVGPLTVTAAVVFAGWSHSSAPSALRLLPSTAFVLSHPLPRRESAAGSSSDANAAGRPAPWTATGGGGGALGLPFRSLPTDPKQSRRGQYGGTGPSPQSSSSTSSSALHAFFGLGRFMGRAGGRGEGAAAAARRTESHGSGGEPSDDVLLEVNGGGSHHADLLHDEDHNDAPAATATTTTTTTTTTTRHATAGAAEICFDPHSFDRGLDPCATPAEDGSCQPPGVVRAAREKLEARRAEHGGHHVDDDDEGEGQDDDDEEVCVMVYDVPATPSYELPRLEYQEGEDEDEKEAGEELNGAELIAEDGGQETGDGEEEDGDDAVHDDDDDDDDEDDPPSPPLCNRGLIIIDNFSPYHGNYISRMALEAYGAGVVSALSNYVTGYLYQEKGMTDHLAARLPDLDSVDDVERWVRAIPFEVVGLVCESDSGLDDAERLGEALGLYPDRHDGVNVARRDKFLMNEACEGAGLRTVRQRMCGSLGEALDFARELGVGSKEEDERDDGEGGEGEEEMYVERNGHDLATAEQRPINGETFDDRNDILRPNELLDDADAPSVLADAEDDEGNEDHDGGDDGEEEHYTMPSNTGVLGLATNDHSSPSSSTRYCVVKPSRGVASDDVHLCHDLQSVEDAFHKIHGSTVFGSIHGQKHESVLVQEFASGTEYAVDIVSKAGHHKVAAVWRYDKRPANGAPFVYHATEVVDADTEVGRAVCEYAMSSLDALNVHWGLSHTEVIVDEDGVPRLVEVNCRQHNTDFAPLTSACIGYNALDMLLAAYLGDAEEFPPNTEHKRLVWDDLPDLPVTRAYGAIVHLVSHSEGILAGLDVDVLEEMEGMSSVLAMEVYPHFTTIGERIEKTVDIRTDSGWLHIMNDDRDQFLADYNRIVEVMPQMFVVEGDDDHDKDMEEEDNELDRIEEEVVQTAGIDK